MDWQHHHGLGGLREDLQDSPWHHFAAVAKLGQTWKIRTCRDLLTGAATVGKTLILLHPNARHPLLAQHWVVYAGRDAKDGTVLVFWGDGMPARRVPDIEEWYSAGAPACAYEILPSGGQTRLTWWQRFYVWLMGRFA
jgi:hypothetical protein